MFLRFSDILPNSKEKVLQSSANSKERIGVILLAGRSNELVLPVERTKLNLIATSSWKHKKLYSHFGTIFFILYHKCGNELWTKSIPGLCAKKFGKKWIIRLKKRNFIGFVSCCEQKECTQMNENRQNVSVWELPAALSTSWQLTWKWLNWCNLIEKLLSKHLKLCLGIAHVKFCNDLTNQPLIASCSMP